MSLRDESITRLNQFIDILQRDGVIRIEEFDHWWPDWSSYWMTRHVTDHGSVLAGWRGESASVEDALFDLCDPELEWEIIVEPKPKPENMLASPQSHIRRVEL